MNDQQRLDQFRHQVAALQEQVTAHVARVEAHQNRRDMLQWRYKELRRRISRKESAPPESSVARYLGTD